MLCVCVCICACVTLRSTVYHVSEPVSLCKQFVYLYIQSLRSGSSRPVLTAIQYQHASADDKLHPVILKWWSLSLPAFLMVVIIFLAGPGAAQVLWGPRPHNDSALIKECSQHWALVQQKIKALWKYCKHGPCPKMETLAKGGATIKTPERHQRLLSIKTEDPPRLGKVR